MSLLNLLIEEDSDELLGLLKIANKNIDKLIPPLTKRIDQFLKYVSKKNIEMLKYYEEQGLTKDQALALLISDKKGIQGFKNN